MSPTGCADIRPLNATRRSGTSGSTGASGGFSPRITSSTTSTTAIFENAGTTASTNSSQTSMTSSRRPTRSRTVARMSSRSRARSRSVTSTADTTRPSTSPRSFSMRMVVTEKMPGGRAPGVTLPRTSRLITGTPVARTSRAIISSASGSSTPYTSKKCLPIRPSTDARRMARVAAFTRTTRN